MKVKIESTSEIIATHGGNLLLGELIARSTIREKMNELGIASAGAEIQRVM